MADFCYQCCEEVLGMGVDPNLNDLRGLLTRREWERGLAASVICEGCGFVQVDPDGRCIGGPTCGRQHPVIKPPMRWWWHLAWRVEHVARSFMWWLRR